jgi:hypothetical protein
MKHTFTLLTAFLSASAAANRQSVEIDDLETRAVTKAVGRWFGRATVERTAKGTLVQSLLKLVRRKEILVISLG